jgi:hypothetical protein
MTQPKLILAAAVAALTLGIADRVETPVETMAPLSESDILVVTNDAAPAGAQSKDSGAPTEDNAQDSAKMGKDEGTHTGADQGATPENDTKKVEQPDRRNPTSGGADTTGSEKE